MTENEAGEEAGRGDHRHDEIIRADAYFRWQRSGQPVGMDLKFWLDAEGVYMSQHPVESTLNDLLREAPTERFLAASVTGFLMPGASQRL